MTTYDTTFSDYEHLLPVLRQGRVFTAFENAQALLDNVGIDEDFVIEAKRSLNSLLMPAGQLTLIISSKERVASVHRWTLVATKYDATFSYIEAILAIDTITPQQLVGLALYQTSDIVFSALTSH